MKREIVFITGASSGIGLALAKQMAALDKYILILTARKESMTQLEALFKDSNHVYLEILDLRNPQEIIDVAKKINNTFGGVDVLVNNAAIIYRAVVEHVLDHEEKRLMQVNYFAPRELIRLFLPAMKKKRKGKIINVSSVGGMMAMPTMSSYSASKFALEGMTESLWYELKPFHIQVTLVQIGFVNSDSFKRLIPTELGSSSDKIYQDYYDGMGEFIEKLMTASFNNPERIALTIYKQAIAKKAVLRIAGTIDAHFFAFFRRFVPRVIYHKFLYTFLPYRLKKLYKQIRETLFKE